MQIKKVSGERIAAAIIDSIFSSIIEFIPLGIYFIVLVSDSGGFNAFIEDFILSSTGTTEAAFGETFQVVTMVIAFVIGVLYFSFIPYKWNGQTIAKKLLKIKAVNEFGDNPTFVQHLIRGIQIWSAYVGVLLLPFILVDFLTYSIISSLVQGLVSLLVFISFIMVLARSDGKGIHDLMAGTMVVKEDTDFNAPFIEKVTKASEWADVELNQQANQDDSWEQPKPKSEDEWDNKDSDDDPWKY
jgi:uncharacterized RDD family membrane protein YckC